MSSPAKFHGAEKVVNCYGEKYKCYPAGLEYLAALGVCADGYGNYEGGDPVSELIGYEEVLEVMKRAGLNDCTDKTKEIRKEIQTRIAAGSSPSEAPATAPDSEPSTDQESEEKDDE